MDWLQRRVMKKTTFPISNAIVKLMLANNAYSAQKACDWLGFTPRPAAATFGDHFQDLINRGLIAARRPQRPVSIWRLPPRASTLPSVQTRDADSQPSRVGCASGRPRSSGPPTHRGPCMSRHDTLGTL